MSPRLSDCESEPFGLAVRKPRTVINHCREAVDQKQIRPYVKLDGEMVFLLLGDGDKRRWLGIKRRRLAIGAPVNWIDADGTKGKGTLLLITFRFLDA